MNHADICTLYDVGEHNGSMFLVMKLLEGESLRAYLSVGRPVVAMIVDIGIQLADALALPVGARGARGPRAAADVK